jgi:hypothetical protein
MYGCFALVSGVNWALMRRPRKRAVGVDPTIVFLIPARNEADNLRRLIPALQGSATGETPRIYVFDDESDDGTAEIAAGLGAIVVRSAGPLPSGWTGKNRACHQLAKVVTEDSDAQWYVFLDADVWPKPGFVEGVRDLLAEVGGRCGVLTGFPEIVSGRGAEPLFLAWVGWVLLATNPYGLVSRTRKGHNRFTNGQFHAWRRDVYTRLWPNEAVRDAILEDVKMGRLCAKEGVPVEVANVSSILAVKMYETWRETFDCMSKNSHEITGSIAGSVALAALMLLIDFGWALAGTHWSLALGLFLLSGLFCAGVVRAKPWGLFALPLAIAIGGATILRSMIWHRRGTVVWKGRTYP